MALESPGTENRERRQLHKNPGITVLFNLKQELCNFKLVDIINFWGCFLPSKAKQKGLFPAKQTRSF